MEDKDKYESVLPENNGGDAVDPAAAAQKEVETLKQERDGLYDRLLRKQAEFENYKKRLEREKAEFAQFASSELMRELLTTVDSFELAIRNASSEGQGSENMLHGFELIYKHLQDTLGRFGLKAVEARGQKFDPNFHQAVSTEATNEVEENTVIDEMRKGYLLNGRLLRPAMVSVAVKKD